MQDAQVAGDLHPFTAICAGFVLLAIDKPIQQSATPATHEGLDGYA